jgi:hypothetical protein
MASTEAAGFLHEPTILCCQSFFRWHCGKIAFVKSGKRFKEEPLSPAICGDVKFYCKELVAPHALLLEIKQLVAQMNPLDQTDPLVPRPKWAGRHPGG